jgi:CBS domain containing-hemolysin-like protein
VDGSVFDEVRGESESLAGLILELTNDLPNVGKRITYKQFTFTIEAVDKRRIKRVRVHIHEHEES